MPTIYKMRVLLLATTTSIETTILGCGCVRPIFVRPFIWHPVLYRIAMMCMKIHFVPKLVSDYGFWLAAKAS